MHERTAVSGVDSIYGERAADAHDTNNPGFFWKSGWAFVLGYGVSAMIQAFVPKGRLTQYMGETNAKSLSLSTLFGTISSSCSFAALATARSLFLKGANFVATVAFMFASTNLVIELGILIYIFLGWQFLIAEVIGGLLLIIISSIIIRLTYPQKWIHDARKKVEEEAGNMEQDFDWKERIKSRDGWLLVGNKFVMEWKMAWEDILIGFTVAGFIAVLVPQAFWKALFLNGLQGQIPAFFIHLENALVAPFVAAATFIGSMGNIPLATVLNANGVLFAGIMGFNYSDLMVPPLVNMNRKYYGNKVAFYIALVMYGSIVLTALLLNYGFDLFHLIPESGKEIASLTAFKVDYTFWFNMVFIAVAAILTYLNVRFKKTQSMTIGHHHHHSEGLSMKRSIVYLFAGMVVIGLFLNILV